MLEKAIRQYQNRSLEAAQVIAELIELAKKMREAHKRGDKLGLTEEELADLWKLTRRCINALTQVMKPDGFNIGINLGKVAGAGIAEHLHIHIVPRWNGDTNFMPVLANTTVLPTALDEVAAKLRAVLAQ